MNQFFFALLDGRRSRHIWLTAQGVLDGPAGQFASLDHIVGGGGVVGLCVADHVDDVGPQRHLQVDASCQLGTGGIHIHRVTQQTSACLPPNAEIGACQWCDDFQAGQHFGQVHCIREARWAVEHQLGNVVTHARCLGVVGGEIG